MRPADRKVMVAAIRERLPRGEWVVHEVGAVIVVSRDYSRRDRWYVGTGFANGAWPNYRKEVGRVEPMNNHPNALIGFRAHRKRNRDKNWRELLVDDVVELATTCPPFLCEIEHGDNGEST